jgi:hypothetical protein
MPINQPLGDMPREEDRGDNAPVPHPRYVTKLAQAWHELYEDVGRDFAGEELRWRASWSGMCAREVSYEIRRRDLEFVPEAERTATWAFDMDGAKATNPPTVADAWRFGLGTTVHDGLQDAVRKAWPGAQVEVLATPTDRASPCSHRTTSWSTRQPSTRWARKAPSGP